MEHSRSLGYQITQNNKANYEIRDRIAKVEKQYYAYHRFFKSKTISRKRRTQCFKARLTSKLLTSLHVIAYNREIYQRVDAYH